MNDTIDYFLSQLEFQENGCWIFTGCPRMRYPSISCFGQRISVHRFAYLLFKGAIPDGSDVHHECEHLRCCNPDHLRALTQLDHYRHHKVKTHCKHGHPFTAENTYFWSGRPGHQMCRECMRRNLRTSRSKKPKTPDPRTQAIQCQRGHSFSTENTYWYRGYRCCKACRREAKARYRSK